jgi:hypothetical protein
MPTNGAILHGFRPVPSLARAGIHLLRDPQEPVALTYDMNVLQGLTDAPGKFLVTLNHGAAIDERKILRTFQYDHPVYTPRGVAAQRRHRELNGAQRTYFCGAYWRNGFRTASSAHRLRWRIRRGHRVHSCLYQGRLFAPRAAAHAFAMNCSTWTWTRWTPCSRDAGSGLPVPGLRLCAGRDHYGDRNATCASACGRIALAGGIELGPSGC